MKIRYQILTGLLTGLAVGAIMWGLKTREIKQQKGMKDIHWTTLQVEGWLGTGDRSTQQVCKIIMGLRADGVLVWKEVLLNGQTSSCVQFETPDAKDQEVVISHVGAVKFVPPGK